MRQQRSALRRSSVKLWENNMENELLKTLKGIQHALVTATVIADSNATQEIREKLLVKVINPAKHSD